MKQENGIVLRNSDGLYYYGMNAFGKELRKANVKRDFVLVNIEIREV